MNTIYLDNNATTQPLPEVAEAMRDSLEQHWHNPSSIHRPGQSAKQKLELARESVCKLLGCADRELVFTSGGTESANMALRGSLQAQPGRRVIVTSPMEHSCIRETSEALEEAGEAEIVWLDATSTGQVDIDHLRRVLTERASEIALVAVMWANNETGLIQPVPELASACREHRVRFFTDATQYVGKMPCNLAETAIDMLGFGAHKFHGPKGIGAIYIRRGLRLPAQLLGGPQERERRGGTENTHGIRGLAAACDAAREWLASDEPRRLESMRDAFERAILERCPGSSVNTGDAPRLWNTSNIAFPRLEAEAILLLLSERGLCASAGAACSSGSLEPSPVLKALGIPIEAAHGSVRLSLSRHTTQDELDAAIETIAHVIERLTKALPVVG